MKILVRIAWRNTVKNWRHSLAAIVSISAGFLSLVLFQGYMTDVNQMYEVGFTNRAMYGHVILENPILNTPEGRAESEKYLLSPEEQHQLRLYLEQKAPDIVTSVRFLVGTGTITNGRNSFMFVATGYDLQEGAVMRAPAWTWETLYGTPLHLSESPQAIVVGQALGFLLGCLPKQKVAMVQNDGYVPEVRPFECSQSRVQMAATTVSGQINAMNFEVVGLLDAGYKDIDEKWVKMSLPNVQRLLNTDRIRFQTVLLKDEKLIPGFISDFERFAEERGLNIKAFFWKQHPVADLYNKTQSLLGIFQIFIVTVILLIASLSVLNTVVKSVKERTREIGTLRSLGFTGKQVRFIFALESLYLSLLGVGLGAGLALITTFVVNQSEIPYRAGLLSEPVLFQIAIDFEAYLLCTVLLSFLAIVASQIAVLGTVRARVAGNLTSV